MGGFSEFLAEAERKEEEDKVKDVTPKVEEVQPEIGKAHDEPVEREAQIEATEPVVESTDGEQEEEPKQSTPRPKWNKIKAMKERNRELEAQNKELAEYVQSMNSQLNKAEDHAIYNYGISAQTTLDGAEKAYKEALKTGSADDITRATANYTLALNDYREAERIVAEENKKREVTKEQQAKSPIDREAYLKAFEQQKAIATDNWLLSNPELTRGSPYYDAKLENAIIAEADRMNQYLAQNNATHVIGTPEYLDKLDDFVDYYKNEGASALAGYGVGVRARSAAPRQEVQLTEIEKNIADSIGMTPSEYKASQARMPESLRQKQQLLRR